MTEQTERTTPTALLSTQNVSRRFTDGDVLAVDDVTLAINRGEFVSLVGKSGSGKSTLLNLLGGLDVPSSGEICYEDKPLSAWGDLARFRHAHLGFVFQSFHLVSVLTAAQNVQLPMFESALSGTERQRRAVELLELVGMQARANHRASKLSGGERQRVAIARALACDPELILADEPTGNLDTKTAGEIIALFQRLNREGKTILMVTHDPSLAGVATRTLTMQDGRLLSA